MAKLAAAGFDPAVEPVPIAPAAHYTMGGIVTDVDGRTDAVGLYAAGECACTGVHGANRLASNSMLECLVFGRRAGLAALGDLVSFSQGPVSDQSVESVTSRRLRNEPHHEAGSARPATALSGPVRVSDESNKAVTERADVTDAARREVWENAGLLRDEAGLRRLRTSPVLLARMLAESALARRESRGGHFRVDFPHEDPALAGLHTVTRPGAAPALERWA